MLWPFKVSDISKICVWLVKSFCLCTFLSLGVPGAFSLLLEWGSFETIASVAGKLGTIQLAAHGVFMSTAGFFYMCPAAISTASAVLVGNRLGDNDAEGAKFFMKLGLWLDFAWGICAGGVLVLVLRPYWAFLYTSDVAIQDVVVTTLPIMMLYITVDSTKCITLNILRSTGRPGVTVIGNVAACLFFMLPLGYFLALQKGYGLVGLWFAMSVAWLIATIGYIYSVVPDEGRVSCFTFCRKILGISNASELKNAVNILLPILII